LVKLLSDLGKSKPAEELVTIFKSFAEVCVSETGKLEPVELVTTFKSFTELRSSVLVPEILKPSTSFILLF
jgi:hypothetical protein